jgi:hypothetical protein
MNQPQVTGSHLSKGLPYKNHNEETSLKLPKVIYISNQQLLSPLKVRNLSQESSFKAPNTEETSSWTIGLCDFLALTIEALKYRRNNSSELNTIVAF